MANGSEHLFTAENMNISVFAITHYTDYFPLFAKANYNYSKCSKNLIRAADFMKRCPQCNSVFDDSLEFCTNDGTPLLQETFVLPSEATDAEEETVIHHEPININIPNQNIPAPTKEFNYQPVQPPVVETIVVEKPRNAGKYVFFLILGLILGGGMVLAAVLLAMFYFQTRTQNANTANRNATVNQSPSPKNTPTAPTVTASSKHQESTDASDDEFNGRVIAQNAYVRYSPSRDAMQIDVLPVNDRINIEERESDSSPWYRVTCEHGTSGWMHGNTIEYTK